MWMRWRDMDVQQKLNRLRFYGFLDSVNDLLIIVCVVILFVFKVV